MDAWLDISVMSLVPLALLALGGLVASRSGILLVALEGLMLGGALVGSVTTAISGSTFTGFVAAVAAGLALGLVLGVMMVRLRADQVVTGIAFNIAMLGATSFVYAVLEAREGGLPGVRPEVISIPGLSDLPGVGVLFAQHWLTFATPLIVAVTWWVMFRTGVGLRLRASGDYSQGAHAAGVNVAVYRIAATVVAGGLAALAGAFLSIVIVQSFTENMTDGRGYIALTIVILGRWDPVGAALGAVLFGAAEGASVVLQGFGGLPAEFFLALPYVLTLATVAVSAKGSRAPREEGRPLQLRA